MPENNTIIGDYLHENYHIPYENIGVITGPCHAEEVALERLSYLTVACEDVRKAEWFAEQITCRYIKTNVSEDIFWFKEPTKILNKSDPPFYKWYEDGVTNTCYNALDIHIDEGKGNKTALIYDSPITGNKSKFTYDELKSKVSRFAGALKDQDVKKGDRVIIYMPMIPEAVIAMLACARIGAIHSVVFGGFASNELASRIDDSKAKLLVTASCGFEPGRTVEYKPLVDEAIKQANIRLER